MSTDYDDNLESDPGEAPKSKSQLKRDMHALQVLGEELVNLSPEQFKKFKLPEALHDAVVEARRIHGRGALKRQLQYVGRMMRDVDPAPIREKLDALRGQSRQAAAQLHRIERWRDRLLEDGDHVLEELVARHPDVDRQYLRQLMRNAGKEKLANKPPRSTRLLFRYLRELMEVV
ncbi:MAG: DUF615 domain-containing protein [Gammaproteobacteria bacterium]|nr:DUF615 domain-containing protein [Gammaproteobacteria bacterium]MCF6364298.1 DUF615 domain-containing protein [Gammaproteobacteria bacterium]